MNRLTLRFFLFLLVSVFFILSCKDKTKPVGESQVVAEAEDINSKAEEIIRSTLKDLLQTDSDLPDSVNIKNPVWVQEIYESKDYQPFWSSEGKFLPQADSLVELLSHSQYLGLFPNDYYTPKITNYRNTLSADRSQPAIKLDAAKWAYVDLLMTAGFVQFVRDLKVGRILPDSLAQRDSTINQTYLLAKLNDFTTADKDSFLKYIEPANQDYCRLKYSLRHFLDSASFKHYTYVASKDSQQLKKLLWKRLSEDDTILTKVTTQPDSADFSQAIKRYQLKSGLKLDGKISSSLITKLNETDQEKFVRIAINLDRFKQLQSLPEQYIWVNLPSYYLCVRENDSVVLKSRVVIGKPNTRTPMLTSALSDMITYPKWTIPESIIKKEILPGLKRNPGYLAKKGFSLVASDGQEVDPYSVDWTRYQNAIPYKVVQGSGDDNALGVLKFNFPNKDAVYLHDTNQRYLFSRSSRALSHGCVRVQDWNDLAKYILRNDSIYSSNATPVDSLSSWLKQKTKRYIAIRKPFPLFIRYFTCEGLNEKVIFYEDVYGEDRKLRETRFNKSFL